MTLGVLLAISVESSREPTTYEHTHTACCRSTASPRPVSCTGGLRWNRGGGQRIGSSFPDRKRRSRFDGRLRRDAASNGLACPIDVSRCRIWQIEKMNFGYLHPAACGASTYFSCWLAAYSIHSERLGPVCSPTAWTDTATGLDSRVAAPDQCPRSCHPKRLMFQLSTGGSARRYDWLAFSASKR